MDTLRTSQFLVYGIKDPRSQKFIYVGQSTRWTLRPYEHLTKQAKGSVLNWRIREMRANDAEPEVIILEELPSKNDLLKRERFWILKLKSEGHDLCNQQWVKDPRKQPRCRMDRNEYSTFIRDARDAAGMDQPTFAKAHGIGLRFLRKVETGQTNIRMDVFMRLLARCGSTLAIVPLQGPKTP